MTRSSRMLLAVLVSFGASFAPGRSDAQCLLANPSFELGGSSGAVFGGWSQFGVVGVSTLASHGAKAARVSGPNTGAWDVSGYWQALDCTPGQRWTGSVVVRLPSSKPLIGGCRAIVNIEWRNSSGALINYESHNVADPSTPRDTSIKVTFASLPAPAGTVSARLLLGALQSPTDPSPDVIYDQAIFVKQTTPSLDQIQWSDFPGGRLLNFSGRPWRVKGPGYYGPGPNLFSDSPSAAWVDADGRMHLTIQKVGGSWYSTEVVLVDTLGYGDYSFTTIGHLDTFDPMTTVFGLFLWEYGACYDPGYLWWNPFNEIDVEFGRWGAPGDPNEQFVAQPYDFPGNRNRFYAAFGDTERTTHAFRWLPGRVEFRSWRGGPFDEATSSPINAWTYTGPHIPRPDQPRVHMNMWQFNGPPSTAQEAVIESFHFLAPGASFVGVPETPPHPVAIAELSLVGANPFHAGTTLRLVTRGDGEARVVILDVTGRLVRTLLAGHVAAGVRAIAWDGLGDSGAPVATGVYLCSLQAGGASSTIRLILLR